ncbi:hypothetical protein ACI68E_002904 [Malassezia pachydermatis]|uniref:DUF7330 domain-containing protein n=1 Tax=Malassezia pachydermatis TaxID=77020 RepID=A0A0M9VP56_9BASI|nr:hypothetical protein Malapachy_3730 [Malassezia pachydermatis]KOS14073.1 hypothetical protein Malapachy_3730 [Malassezia pachydermatis]
MAVDHDAEPLLEEGRLHEDQVYTLDEDAAYVLPQQRRYLYAPISYEQAMRPHRPMWHPLYWYDLARENSHVFDMFRPSDRVKWVWDRTTSVLTVLWPHSRIHQTILIILGLWVLLSYANWSVSQVLPRSPLDGYDYWSFHDKLRHDLANVHLAPRPGDGLVDQNATWSFLFCYSTGEPLRYIDAIRCKNRANFTLEPFPQDNSLSSTDHSYLFVNPVIAEAQEWYPRTVAKPVITDEMLERSAPMPPAYVYMVKHAVPDPSDEIASKIHVYITATYDKEAVPMLQRAMVAKLSHGLTSSGVEILTARNPEYGSFVAENHNPLEFDIVVSFPETQPVSGFVTDIREGFVEAFTEKAYERARELHHEASLEFGKGSWSLFGGPMKLKPKEATPEEQAEMRRLRDIEQFFGRFTSYVQYGTIHLGGVVRAHSEIIAKTLHGSIASSAKLMAQYVYMWTHKGPVTLHQRSFTSGHLQTHLSSNRDSIEAYEDAHIFGSKTSVKSVHGNIKGPALYHANFSLEMTTDYGMVEARVSVEKPMLVDVSYDDFLHAEEGRRVEATLQARDGHVYLDVVSQQAGVPFRAEVHSDKDEVEVHLPAEYEGILHVQGTEVQLPPPPTAQGRHWEPMDVKTTAPLAAAQARVYYDETARGPAPPTPPSTPVHLEPGKTPIDYGASVTAYSAEQQAKILIT